MPQPGEEDVGAAATGSGKLEWPPCLEGATRRGEARCVFGQRGRTKLHCAARWAEKTSRGRGAEGPVDSLAAHLFIQPTKGSAGKASKSPESFQNSSSCQAWAQNNLLSQPFRSHSGGCKFLASLGYRARSCLQRKREGKK